MAERWIGPNNGDGQVINFGISKSEIEYRRDEITKAAHQLGVLSELSTNYITEVCDSLEVDPSTLNLAIEVLRKEADLLILELERHW